MANLITLSRIFLVIPFVLLFTANAAWNMNAALAVFALAAVSDFFDGWVARARNEISALGATLDPIADKLLVTAGLFLLVRNGFLKGPEVIGAILIVSREILVSGLREGVAAKGATLPVRGLAKWKTTAQLLAVGLLIASAPTAILGPDWRSAAGVVFWIAALLTVWTGLRYALAATKLLREQQSDKRP